jgi:hypothetical protein
MGSFFSDTLKLRFVDKMAQRHAKRPGKGKIRTLLQKYLPTLLTKVLGIDQATVDTLKATFESRKPVREELRTSFQELHAQIQAHLQSETPDEEASRLLVIQLKELHQKALQAKEDGLQEIRSKLSVKARAELVAKLFGGAQKLGTFASYFVDIEELKFFL